jgi:hypothetical protein
VLLALLLLLQLVLLQRLGFIRTTFGVWRGLVVVNGYRYHYWHTELALLSGAADYRLGEGSALSNAGGEEGSAAGRDGACERHYVYRGGWDVWREIFWCLEMVVKSQLMGNG